MMSKGNYDDCGLCFIGCHCDIGTIGRYQKTGVCIQESTRRMESHAGKDGFFVENESEPENADGVRGHLEAVGESSHKASFYEATVKRCLDIILSFFGIIILSPLFAILSLWIVIDDPGPVLFTQKRIGRDKQYFKLHKFRSMKLSTPHNVPTHMLENPEQYITKLGRFIRTHSLDEQRITGI